MSDAQTTPASAVSSADGTTNRVLYLRVDRQGDLKLGTCAHCVLRETARPERAWNAAGDRELDFPRDALLAALARLGVTTTIEEEYVCP
jgi:hypothetical protein